MSAVKKQISYYYDPISFKEYDVIINPSIVEPVIQIGMEIKVHYTLKTEPIETEVVNNKYFIISSDGAVNVKELKLNN